MSNERQEAQSPIAYYRCFIFFALTCGLGVRPVSGQTQLGGNLWISDLSFVRPLKLLFVLIFNGIRSLFVFFGCPHQHHPLARNGCNHCLSFYHSINLSICLSACLPVCTVCLSFRLSVSVSLSVSLSLSLAGCLFVCQSVCPI